LPEGLHYTEFNYLSKADPDIYGRAMARSLILLAILLGCSGSQTAPRVPEPPAPETTAALVGPLCSGTRCTCRSEDADIGKAPAGYKRFEVVLGPNQHELWATIGDQVFYKSLERAQECFYVDLPAGEHPVELQAQGEAGFGARLKISEKGEGAWWYDTFEFACGAPGLCDHDGLDSWKRRIAQYKEGKHDPCGSVRVLGIDWQTGRMPDMLHPEDFLLQATLKVYKFAPKHPPGDSSCDPSGGEPVKGQPPL
jgi:hypothetical protein